MVGAKDNLCTVIVSIGDKMRGEVRERIHLDISSSWFVYKAEVEATKIKGPSCLTASEVLDCVPVLKIAMVRDDVEGKGEPLKVVVPVFKGMDNSKHLLIINFIILFSVNHRLRTEGNGVPEIVIKLLEEDAFCGIARHINFNPNRVVGIPHG